MSSEIKILYRSDFFTVTDFKCKCNLKGTSGVEHRSNFTMSFTRLSNPNLKNLVPDFLMIAMSNLYWSKPIMKLGILTYANNKKARVIFIRAFLVHL